MSADEADRCACTEITWPTGALSVYADDVHHFPAGLICFALDGAPIWAVAS